MTTAKISGLQIFDNSVSSSIIVNFDGAVSSSAVLSGFRSIPAGTVSSSGQVTSLLPAGTVSSSTQINTGSFTGSFVGQFTGSLFGTSSFAQSASVATSASFAPTILPAGTVSSSAQVSYIGLSNIPSGIVSSSNQFNALTNTSASFATTAATAGNVTTNANLTGNVTSVGNATTIASGVVTSAMIVDGTIVNGDINASAAIVDTKLATISTGGKVSNSATTATNANTASTIVARDASGNFSAGTITATLSGSATTATTVNGTIGQLLTKDDRIIEPNSISSQYLQFGFTSWANDNTAPYADFLHMRSYGDGSGGNDNLIVFKKDTIGMRIYQRAFGSATAYSSYADVWTSVNDGAGSGLDADLLDGQHGSYYTTAGNLTGTIPSAVLGNSSLYVGTTAIALNRASLTQTLTGVSIDGNAGSVSWANITGVRTLTRDDAGTSGSLTTSGFFETSTPTNYYSGASSWQHLIEARHTNDSNNYAMQIAGSFFDQEFYVRKTNNSGVTAWSKLWHSTNDGAGSGLDADLLDGYSSATANTANTIVLRDASGNFSAGTITATLTGNASTVTTNANLTGHITSTGNATVLGSFTSAQLLAALTDETGTGANVFATSPTLVTPALGTPASGIMTNVTGTATGLTAGNVITNANLTGNVTSVGNATTIASGVVTDAMLAGSISNAKLTNSAITIGSTSTALGATSTTIAGLTSVTSTTFVGALTGNASTVTNGMYLTGDQIISGVKTFYTPASQTYNAASGNIGLSVFNSGAGDAMMTFHVSGDYAGYFGLGGAENDLVWTGWSVGNIRHRIWHAGNDGAGSGLDADLLDGYSSATANTANTIVLRDASGNFSAGTITATSLAVTGATTLSSTLSMADNVIGRPRFTDYAETYSTPAISSGTLTLNIENGNVFRVSLTAAITTLTISNPSGTGNACSFTLIFDADGTARAVTWPAAVKWPGGTAPTLTSTASRSDMFVFYTNNAGTTWYAMTAAQNFVTA